MTKIFNHVLTILFCLGAQSFFAQDECDGTDITNPIISASMQTGDGSCGYPQPAATATDNSGGMVQLDVSLEISSAPAVCMLVQPDIGDNLCDYADIASMLLMSMPAEYKFYTVESGSWTAADDGTAHISAIVHCNAHPNGKFAVDVNFSSGMTWDQWSGIPGRSYKADCGGVGSEHPNWMYYIMSSGSLIGFGDFQGSQYTLTHAPGNYQYGYQVGLGANNYSDELGSGGWFVYTGTLIDNGVTISTYSGAGDFMFRHDCYPAENILQYVYTATDVCDNASVFTQEILTCGTEGPLLANMPLAGTVMTPCEMEAWQPIWLPDSCDGLFTYTTSYAMGNVEGSNDYLVTITIDALACGVPRSYSFSVVIPEESELPCIDTSCIADINGDQIVTTSDVIALIADFLTENELTDLNQDGVVNIPDLIIVISSFGSICD